MDNVSITVPMDYNALTRAADMLHGLAIDMKHQGNAPVGKSTTACDDQFAPEPVTVQEPGVVTERTIVATFTEAEPVVEKKNYPGSVFDNPAPAVAPVVVSVPETATVATGVEVDKHNLPWDERIHSNGENKKKADGSWKAKRNVDPALVQTVEAELRAAMAVPSPNVAAQPAPVVVSPTITPVIAPTVETVPNVAPVVTPAVAPVVVTAPAVNSGITTLPQLMAAATGAGKTPGDMRAAAQAAGLASIALLGARPDLIPVIAASMGLGG